MEVKRVLTLEDYKSLRRMMDSNVETGFDMAITIIQECDLAKSLGYIALLRKRANFTGTQWHSKAKEVHTLLASYNCSDGIPTWQAIYNIVKQLKLSADQIKLIHEEMLIDMLKGLKDFGQELTNIEVTINFELNEPEAAQ